MSKQSIVATAIITLCFVTLIYTIAPAAASPGFNDEFNAATLGSNWNAVDPTSTNPFSLSSHSGWLRITTTAGPEYNLARTTMTSPRIFQTVTGDFEITTEVSGNFAHATVAAGLLVWKDSSNFWRVERWYDPTDHGQAVHTAGNYHGTWTNGAYQTLPTNQDPTYLKITRVGTTLTGYWSTDGSTWTQFAQTTFDAADPVSVGLSVINVGGGTFNADFNFFHIIPSDLSVLPEAPIALVLPAAMAIGFVVYRKRKQPLAVSTV